MEKLLLNRRSLRKFKDIPIEKEKLDKIIELSLTAPSGRNKKPWELIIVDNKDTLHKISDARPGVINFLKTAPLGIVVIFDPESGTALADASIIASYIQLIAESLGLKSCWGHAHEKITDNGEDVEENIRKISNIPGNIRVLCVIGIGYGDEDKKPHDLSKLPMDKVHFNNY